MDYNNPVVYFLETLHNRWLTGAIRRENIPGVFTVRIGGRNSVTNLETFEHSIECYANEYFQQIPAAHRPAFHLSNSKYYWRGVEDFIPPAEECHAVDIKVKLFHVYRDDLLRFLDIGADCEAKERGAYYPAMDLQNFVGAIKMLPWYIERPGP